MLTILLKKNAINNNNDIQQTINMKEEKKQQEALQHELSNIRLETISERKRLDDLQCQYNAIGHCLEKIKYLMNYLKNYIL